MSAVRGEVLGVGFSLRWQSNIFFYISKMNALPAKDLLTKESIQKGEPFEYNKVVDGKYYYMRCEVPGAPRIDYVISRKGIIDDKELVTIYYKRDRNGEKVVRGIEARNEWEDLIGEIPINPEKCKFFGPAPHTGGGRQRRAKSHRKRNNRRKSTRRNSRR